MALIRRARSAGAFAYVRHHGDDDAGAVLIKTMKDNKTAMLWVPERDENYTRIWVTSTPEPCPDEDIEEIIKTRLTRDPDLWVIEIEDSKGRHFLLDDETRSVDL